MQPVEVRTTVAALQDCNTKAGDKHGIFFFGHMMLLMFAWFVMKDSQSLLK